ncbi:ABC transporter substrate-binding protein [Desulfobaculum bizertense]|uniref:Amino acid ABC transporter substrate-binding protein, PAAT family (TC 3.A.1.3.-) n=1 Tax=Desulfobaculum bizertense DSM 18034 TaxID=1121442 RepID=A0A1T4WZJ7_9BACT|nr:ABC transporter substrate-binding protein [Desulfobaculum bizertense]UIJ37356.1 ABC transporter substrate-binding protein [Desulfobaculum bizertense]SKA82803.1 amino acid ABC transporter substrate-binding protein, PAAT family (TC 3.A.1.3.-) [Desulfobaculum bizertense DSM 18034]
MGKKLFACMLGMLLTAMLATGAIAGDKKVYVNGIDFGFPPFGYIDKHGEPAGFDVDSVNWIAEKMGFEVRHQPMDWDGIIPALNAGKLDFIACGMSATDERRKVVAFTNPYYEVTQVLVVNKNDDSTFKEMFTSGKVIGAQRGTPSAKYLDELSKKEGMDFKVKKYDSTDLSMQDLPIGRIDASAMDSTIAYEMMRNLPCKVVGTLDVDKDVYAYAFRKGDTELEKKLNEGLKQLMADPYWEELKAKWNIH